MNRYEPQNMTEQSIENALVEMEGVRREDIQFHSVVGGTEARYVRVGYWRPISDSVIGELGLIEDSDYDDDCGYKYCYFY